MERDISFLVLGIVLGVVLFSGNVQGIIINEFNDSTTEKNLIYNESGSQLAYITIPKYGYYTTAELNLSAYIYTQDEEDSWINPDGNCWPGVGWLCDLAVDENWSTFAAPFTGASESIYENYTLTYPDQVDYINITWKIQHHGGGCVVNATFYIYNYTSNAWIDKINYSDTTATNVSIIVNGIMSDYIEDSTKTFSTRVMMRGCYQDPSYYQSRYFESQITVSHSLSNLTLDTANDDTIDWNFTGELNLTNSPQQADLNITAINNFLSTCSADSNGYCNISLNISSDTAGILQLDTLNITYSFDNLLLECGGISNTTALNFSVFVEENNTESIRSDFEAEFDIRIFSITSNTTFDITNQTYLEVCIYPSWGEYIIDATLKYTNNPNQSTNYSTRYYFLQSASIDNITDDIFLYLLEESDSNQITFIIKNIYNLPQEDIIVKVTRFFISDDVYRQIDMGLSDFDGEATTQLKLNEWYIFIIEQNGQILRTFSQKFLTSTGDITLFTEIGTQIEYFTYFDSLGASCIPNNVTSLLTCTFSDTSGKMAELNLTIEKRQLVGGFLTICTNTTTASSGTISCSYTGNNDTELAYFLTGRFCCSQTTFFTLLTGVISGAVTAPFGTIGVIMMLFILIASVLYGYWNPAVPIIMGLFGIVIGMMLQLIMISSISVLSLVIAGGIIIYKMRT